FSLKRASSGCPGWAAFLIFTRRDEETGARHEDSQQLEVAQVAPPRLPRDPPPRTHLRHQQDEPALQGSPGLSRGGQALKNHGFRTHLRQLGADFPRLIFHPSFTWVNIESGPRSRVMRRV